jgi:uncharacterized protein YndB with AHSA1/START domain/DNA-binding transcriptional ArsR family regulator
MDQQDETDAVFKALADPHRRLLLDLLFAQDGQTLLQLQQHLPMTRFGAMRHLQVLEAAGLLTARKVGREKFHYLNPVPIRLIQDRWVSKYAQPWMQTLAGLKFSLEETAMTQKPSHVYQLFIRTTPERLWQALTDGEMTQSYYFADRVESTWEVGSSYRLYNPSGAVDVEGKILEIDPPRRLVTTFTPTWDQSSATSIPSTVTWEIVPVGEACRLSLIHDGMDEEAFAAAGMDLGWTQVISGLKTFLETGQALVIDA